MSRARWWAGVCACALSLIACEGAETTAPPDSTTTPGQTTAAEDTMSPEAAPAALDFVVAKVESIHADTRIAVPPAFTAAVSDARERLLSPVTEKELFLILDRMLVPLRDAHTALDVRGEALADYEVLPLPFTWLQEGMIVTTETGPLQRGDLITSVGGLDEAALLAALRAVIPSENDHFLRSRAPELLPREDLLRHLDLLDEDGSVAVELERAGETTTVHLPLAEAPAPPPEGPSVTHEIDPEHSLALLRIDRCVYDAAYDTELRDFMTKVAEAGIPRIAVDLRRNRGGNVLVAPAFLAYLKGAADHLTFGADLRVSDDLLAQQPAFASDPFKQLLQAFGIDPESDNYALPGPAMKVILGSQILTPTVEDSLLFDGEVYILTSPLTFSSASLFTSYIQDNTLGTILGEPTGNEIDFHGQNLTLEVPGTSLHLSVSTSRLRRPDTTQPNEPTITPDILVPLTRKDVLDGTDPVREWLNTH